MADESAIRNPQSEIDIARAYFDVAQTRQGQIMIADLEAKFGCNPFQPGDPHVTSFQCGTLRVLQEISEQIRRAKCNPQGQGQGQGQETDE